MRSGVLRLAPGPFLTAPPKRPLKGETSLRYLPCSLFLGVRMGLGPDGRVSNDIKEGNKEHKEALDG